ncbi:hypothetical protein SAMN05444340_105210 [Citreimonas salinaria]|uniref:Uncharacterized protein n=2 Tax=Citreimonas salinaria TaxID=321339 RepID=A0A1H3IQG1_9RHOB|nr:hypothetical protein SAMN05444340_105210 [Citreimonas salinaria]
MIARSNSLSLQGRRRIKKCKLRLKEAKLGLRHEKLIALQDVAVVEKMMRDDPREEEWFVGDKFWVGRRRKPKIGKHHELLFYLLIFVFGGGRNADKNASLYHTSLQAVLLDGVPRNRIAVEIEKRGGIRAVAEAHRERLKVEPVGANVKGNPSKPARTAKATTQKPSTPALTPTKVVTVTREMNLNRDIWCKTDDPGKIFGSCRPVLACKIIRGGKDADGYDIFRLELD